MQYKTLGKVKRAKVTIKCNCGHEFKLDSTLYWFGLVPLRCPCCCTLECSEDFPDAYESV